MARPLVVVAVTGVAVSVLCLSLAGALRPGEGFPYGPPFPYDRGWWRDGPWSRGEPFTDTGEIVTREFSWDGDNRAEIYIPGVVYYEPEPEWRVTVTGRESSVEHLRIEDGRILFDRPYEPSRTSPLEVRITGPSLERVGVNGSGKVILENVAQKELEIDVRGSGSVQGQGAVEKLELRILGSGNADLGELATEDTEISIYGSGNAEIAPTGDAEVLIVGSGEVRLRTRPRNLSTRVTGSGRIIQLETEASESRHTEPDSGVSHRQRSFASGRVGTQVSTAE
ncbi:MAG: DUF2807 domain-containing protein [Gammaproteobacteria bacterium PRO9]|nr:DUF2807 domain-containing protein [Gammaproteobacteria bacterium PRO9]